MGAGLCASPNGSWHGADAGAARVSEAWLGWLRGGQAVQDWILAASKAAAGKLTSVDTELCCAVAPASPLMAPGRPSCATATSGLASGNARWCVQGACVLWAASRGLLAPGGIQAGDVQVCNRRTAQA